MAVEQKVSDAVFTIANVISFVRLCMAPIALAVLLAGHDIAAALIFGATAATDFLDGQIARRTNTVTKLGQLLDPAVDRLLMICAVVGLLAIGRLPLWVVAVVLIRDGVMLAGGAWLLKEHQIRISVVYSGKVATTFLYVGLAGLMLNYPLIEGLGWCDFPWLPGFNSVASSWGIWLIYIGMCLALATTVYYVVRAITELRKAAVRRIDE